MLSLRFEKLIKYFLTSLRHLYLLPDEQMKFLLQKYYFTFTSLKCNFDKKSLHICFVLEINFHRRVNKLLQILIKLFSRISSLVLCNNLTQACT